LFCDLVGSTALSSRLDPEDLRAVIAAYHRQATEVIQASGGFVSQYMGDGVLAYFGYPQAHEDDAEQAVRAGLGLVDAIARLSPSRPCSGSNRRQASSFPGRAGGRAGCRHVGIATGPSSSATGARRVGAGAGGRRETQLAARLQAPRAQYGRVAASTRRLLGGRSVPRSGTTVPKGFAEPVPAFQVLRPSARAPLRGAQERGSVALVGREEELELLLCRWRQAGAGASRWCCDRELGIGNRASSASCRTE
jgi:class 3 adenylate cyclase